MIPETRLLLSSRLRLSVSTRKLRRTKENVRRINSSLIARRSNFGCLPPDSDRIWKKLGNQFKYIIRTEWDKTGLKINLTNPCTLAEKIEWLKLNCHREIFPQVVDKIAVRNYVLSKTKNSKLLNNVYGIYKNVDEINIADLPKKFVLKPSHCSGKVLTVSNTNELDHAARIKLSRWLNLVYGIDKVEWPYWSVVPQLVAEEYLEDQFLQLVDYKWFCFNGEPKFVMVCTDRLKTGTQKLFFDMDWCLMPFSDPKYPTIPIGKNFPRPDSLDEMLTVARQLSEDFEFVRVDLYDVHGQCRFGEMTLYPESGIRCQFLPSDWNSRIGEWLQLPKPIRKPSTAYFCPYETIDS